MERINIEKILENKELFWKYILGNKCAYCKAQGNKPHDAETIEDVQEGKGLSEQEKKIALLKAKLNKKKTEPQDFVCVSDKCFDISYANMEKIEEKYNKMLVDLKGNIDFWNKKGYNIDGYCKDNNYYISFQKNDKIIEYNNMNEVFNKNSLINSEDIIMLAEYLKIIK